jgi:hypothetical protein
MKYVPITLVIRNLIEPSRRGMVSLARQLNTFGSNYAAWGDHDGASNDVFQLANVAGPIVTEYKVQRVLSNGNRPVRTSEEALHQEWNIFTAFAQRRQRNGYDIQSVIRVLSELARFDHVRDVLSRGSDQWEINANRLIASKALDRLLLYHSQKLHLQGWTKITDLIEVRPLLFA